MNRIGKKTKLIGIALILLVVGLIAGFLSERIESTSDKKAEKVQMDNKTDEQLAQELGSAKAPIFKVVDASGLEDEQKKIVNILREAVGVNLHGDLFIVVPEKGKNKLRLITEVHEEGKVKVYIKKVGANDKGKDMIIGKIKDFDKQEVWFLDAETKEPIQLENLEVATKSSNSEVSKATSAETKNTDAKGDPVPKERGSDAEGSTR